MARPPVTAVIPTRDRPQLVRRAVESVLAQDYDGDVEVVVVFDRCEPCELPTGGRDGRDVRATVARRPGGLARARNSGIAAASYDHVAFLDDDDVWLPGKLDAQMAVFEQTPDAVLVGCAVLADDGRRTHLRRVSREVVRHADLVRDRTAGLHPSTFVLSRSALLGPVGLLDEDLPGSYGEDWDLLLRAAAVAPVRVVDRPLVRVTWTGRSHFLGQWSTYADGLAYLLDKHPAFRADRRAYGGIAAKLAFAHAAAGDRRAAVSWAGRSLARAPLRPKAWLALATALRVVSAERVVAVARRLGRGV